MSEEVTLDEKVDRLIETVGTIAEGLNRQGEKINTMAARLEEHDERFDAIMERMGKQDEKIDSLADMVRAVVNGQSAMKDELLGEIRRLDAKIDGVEERLTARMDRLGKELAVVDDDAVSREDFEDLDKRVTVLEQERLAI